MTSSFFIEGVIDRQDAPPQTSDSFLTLRGTCPPDFEAQAYGTRGALRCVRVTDPPRQTNPSTKDYRAPSRVSSRPGEASSPRARPRRYRTTYPLESPRVVQSRRLYEVNANPLVQVDRPGGPTSHHRPASVIPTGLPTGKPAASARCRRPPEELDLIHSGHLRRGLEFDGIGFSRATEDEATYLRGPLPNPPRRYVVTDLHQKSEVWLARTQKMGLKTDLPYERVV